MWPFYMSIKPVSHKKKSADAYVDLVGPHVAKGNAETMIGLISKDTDFRSPYWEQVLNISKKKIKMMNTA